MVGPNASFYFKIFSLIVQAKGVYNNKTNDMKLEKRLKWFRLKTKFLCHLDYLI